MITGGQQVEDELNRCMERVPERGSCRMDMAPWSPAVASDGGQAATIVVGMETIAAAFTRLTAAVATTSRLSFPPAEVNDVLTSASGQHIEGLPAPEIEDPYRLNYVTAMVELAANRVGASSTLDQRCCTSV
jgi:hypothetical protein